MRTRLTLVVDLRRGDRVRVDGRPCTIVRISSDPDNPLLVPEGAAR